jgi:capsular polysaccharide biosynthesis protein
MPFMVPTGWDRFRTLPPYRLQGSVASIASYAGQGYFHWIFDVLPRIGLLRLAGVDVASLNHLIVNASTAPFQLETLAHLGLNRSTLRSIGAHPQLSADELWATSHPRQIGHIPDWACEFLMDAFLDSSPPRSDIRRVFISRARATHGRVPEEAELLERLEPLGFQALALEQFSLVEKARLFHNAEAVIAPSGAGLSHLAFGQPGTVVIELMNRGHAILDYWDLANRRGMQYGYVDWSGPIEQRVSDLMATLALAGV